MVWIIDHFRLQGVLCSIRWALETKIKHEVRKSLKHFERSGERSGTDSRSSCVHSQPPPVLAQVPPANWPAINHIHSELHDQLRKAGLLHTVSAGAVHFPGPHRIQNTEKKGNLQEQMLLVPWQEHNVPPSRLKHLLSFDWLRGCHMTAHDRNPITKLLDCRWCKALAGTWTTAKLSILYLAICCKTPAPYIKPHGKNIGVTFDKRA